MFQVEVKNFAGNWVRLGKPCENAGDAEERVRLFRNNDRRAQQSFEYRVIDKEAGLEKAN